MVVTMVQCSAVLGSVAPAAAAVSTKMMLRWLLLVLAVSSTTTSVEARTILNAGNPDAKRLYDDLLSNYNKLVRPVVNTTDPLTVRIKLKLSQLIDVNLKNQIMTTNLWVEQFWYDYKLVWDPQEYGGVKQLHVPSDHIWRPDIVLYNKSICATCAKWKVRMSSHWELIFQSSTCPSNGTFLRCLLLEMKNFIPVVMNLT